MKFIISLTLHGKIKISTTREPVPAWAMTEVLAR